MTPRKDDPIEALSLVEWYASTLNASAAIADERREETLNDVLNLTNESALSERTRKAVVRVVLCVQRLDMTLRRIARDEAREGAKAASLRAAQVATVAAAVVLFVASLLFRWERAALVAFLCFVGAVAPVLFAKLIQATQGKGD